MIYTLFADRFAANAERVDEPFAALCDRIEAAPIVANKGECALVKLATFGEQRSARDSLRTNDNMLPGGLCGVEGDYDGEEIGPEVCAALLRNEGVTGFVYTSPSHKPERPRWRVLCPTSKPLGPKDRDVLVRRLNAVLGGVLSPESFTRSQAFYFGRVRGATFETFRVDGRRCIDEAVDIVGVEKKRTRADARGQPYPAQRRTPDDELVSDIEEGNGLHPALLSLAWRGWTEDQLREVLERSKAKEKRPDEWAERLKRLPRIVASAKEKRVQQAAETFRDEARRESQIAEAKRIGEATDEAPLPVVMNLDEMLRDLVYVGDSGAVVHTPTMRVRTAASVAGEYAASKEYVETAAGVTPVPAIKLWRASERRVSVDGITWAPGAPLFTTPPEGSDAGGRAINIWRGLPTMTAPDDWQERARAWEEHLAYLVAVEAERERFVQWLAHIVQAPGVLPHTAYLMFTPTRGIGRNWISGVLARALAGFVASGVSLGQILDGSFNDRLSRKLLAVVDETREGHGVKKYERGNALQRIVTEELREINPKFGVKRIERNCCRWLMLTNFADALPFDNEDRRIIVIENPTERREASYYARLYGLLGDAAFIASVRRWLEMVDVSGFNPGGHAPMNAAKRVALASLESELDQVVREFAEAWPGALCGRDDVRRYARDCLGGASVDERHLSHAMDRAGLIATGVRVRVGHALDRVVIVRAATVAQVKAVHGEAGGAGRLVATIREAGAKFALG